MRNELKDTISYNVNSYGKTFEKKLGLTKDDLLNDVREQIWKGLLTHSPKGKANLKTYLNKIITNRFLVLLKKSSITKYNSVDYFGDVFSAAAIDREHLETEETGESLLERRQAMARVLLFMTHKDRKVFGDLIMGYSLGEMVKRQQMVLPEVIGAINRIDSMIKQFLKEVS